MTMSRIWTGSEGRRAVAAVLAAGALLLLPSCGKSKNENKILPVSADIRIDNPATFPAPSVFLQKVSASGDLVIVDVMLRTSSAVTFDAFDLDLTFDPGIVQLGGNVLDPLFATTPFCGHDATNPVTTDCFCNASVTNVCNITKTQACKVDADCPIIPASMPLTNETCVIACTQSPTTNPICQNNGGQANSSGEFILGVAAATGPGSGCPAITAPAGTDTRLFRLGFVAASTGSSPIHFVPFSSTNTGGCAILSGGANLGIPCVDGNATFTASR